MARMSIEQYIEIANWIKIWKEKIHVLRLTQRDVQEMLFEQLKYEVPLSTLARCATGIEWTGSPAKPPPVPIDREAIIILIGALEGLYVETGRTTPDDLANLHSAYIGIKETSDETVHPAK